MRLHTAAPVEVLQKIGVSLTGFSDRMLECIHDGDPNALRHVDDAEQKRDLSEAAAEVVLLKSLNRFGMRRDKLSRVAKSAPGKMLTAGLLRYYYPVSAAWIAEALSMGHYTTVTRAVRLFDDPGEDWEKEKGDILKLSDGRL